MHLLVERTTHHASYLHIISILSFRGHINVGLFVRSISNASPG